MSITVANMRSTRVGEYVGRPSPLGNPYRLRSDEPRGSTIARYEIWLREKIARRDRRVCDELNRLFKIARDRGNLTLLCWCAPRPCHADVIRRILLEALDDYNLRRMPTVELASPEAIRARYCLICGSEATGDPHPNFCFDCHSSFVAPLEEIEPEPVDDEPDRYFELDWDFEPI